MDLTAPLDAAIESVTRLRGRLARGTTVQVRNSDERMIIKATAQAWFRTQRPQLAPLDREPLFGQVSQAFVGLLELAEQHTTRAKYLDLLKSGKADLVTLRSKAALADPQSAVRKPAFGTLISDVLMLAILERRWAEMLACLGANAPLAATVMMGGLLEALFLVLCPINI